jgi:adenylate cyclase
MKQTVIRQAYLGSNSKSSIRVRIKDDRAATLTIKSRPIAVRRLELEYDIPLLQAEALMALRQGTVIEKVRHDVPHGGLTWEVDVFVGENQGLVIAEVELQREGQEIALPPWIGAEITSQSRYYNSSLVLHPFGAWPRQDAAMEKIG